MQRKNVSGALKDYANEKEKRMTEVLDVDIV